MSTTTETPIPTESEISEELQRIFNLQQRHHWQVARTTARERIAKLRRFEKALFQHRKQIQEALYADFRKPPGESDLTEIYAVLSEIRHAIRHLRRWMAPQPVPAPLMLINSRSHIVYEPKGVVLILSPWNYPVNLTFGPLVSALAAGNCVMIKPSELIPHTSSLMARIIRETFPEEEVALVEGGVETAQALLELPFNHIFYTGSPTVGKIIMQAAAKHLASVTLELGGKSPTIVDETANLDLAATRIAWTKFANNGQTCIAPDYLLVQEQIKDKLLQHIKQKVQQFFGANPQASDDYARVVNQRHFARLQGYLDEAIAHGAKIIFGGDTDPASRYMAPTIVEAVPEDTKLLKEEIFGPILPVRTFRHLSEAVDFINAKERPLALYIYSRKRRNIEFVARNTRSGALSINHSAVHFFNNDLPFGGVNNSGVGKAHGWFGFEAFSNAKGVFRQNLPGGLELVLPPYTRWKRKIIDLVLRWL